VICQLKSFKEKWEVTRQKGKKAYVQKNGILFFGMGSVIIFSIIELFSYGNISIPYFGIRLVIFPIIGLMIFGQRWDSRENKYHRMLNRN